MSGYGGGQLAAAFTVSQWHELEHQVLIFKYLRAGLPVPPDLLAPIRTSLHLLSSSLFHHSHAHPRPTLGYCSYDGKKIDPEPGRCRRTDGKKWRCSKDAHPSSKYCERHMNRNRYRSRKPVESRTASQTGSLSTGNSSGSSGSSQNPPLHSIGNHEALCFRSNVSRSDMDPTPYRISSTDYRSLQGLKAEADDGVISVGLESAGLLSTNSSMNSAWHLSMSPSPANSLSDERNGAFLQNSCPPLHMLQNFDPQITNSRISKQQQQHYFFGREFGSSRSVKQENLSFQPLPDELPKTIDFGCYMDDQRAKNSLCTTQLSMAIPMASSECFGNSANSSKDASMDKFLS